MSQPVFAVSDTTQKILKNFSAISGQLLLREGQVQKTIGGNGPKTTSVFAVATLPEAWPKETPIYSLDAFLGTLSLFDKPAIQFDKDAMVVANEKSGALKVKYRYSDPATIEKIHVKELPTDNPAIEFILTNYALNHLKKTAALLKLTHFTIAVDADKVSITGADPKNPNSHVFELAIPAGDVTRHDAAFARALRFQIAHFGLLLDGDYTVALTSGWKYAYLTHKASPVAYFVAEDRRPD